MRKHTLEYDDVMNKQRKEVYAFRNDLLFIDKPLTLAAEVMENVCVHLVEEANGNQEHLIQSLQEVFPIHFEEKSFEGSNVAQKTADKIIVHSS